MRRAHEIHPPSYAHVITTTQDIFAAVARWGLIGLPGNHGYRFTCDQAFVSYVIHTFTGDTA